MNEFSSAGLLALFGERVREFREAAKMTRPDLSKRCGLTVNELTEIERAQTDPPLLTMIAIARAIGCSVADLVEIDD
jgi:transcriptional regulator with XRE-family HTH domain